jgi:[ribosomal protein S5]-alanine N-acetyltransferase
MPGDRASFLEAVARSRSLHHPWAYPPDTSDAFDAYIEAHPSRRTLAVVIEAEEPLAGVYALSQIHHGAFRNAYLGYYAFLPHAGDGYMREAMPLLFRHAFGGARAPSPPGERPAGERALAGPAPRDRVA